MLGIELVDSLGEILGNKLDEAVGNALFVLLPFAEG